MKRLICALLLVACMVSVAQAQTFRLQQIGDRFVFVRNPPGFNAQFGTPSSSTFFNGFPSGSAFNFRAGFGSQFDRSGFNTRQFGRPFTNFEEQRLRAFELNTLNPRRGGNGGRLFNGF